MKTRKILSMVVACMMLTGALTACGDKSKSSSSSSSSAGSSSASSDSSQGVLDELGLDENLRFKETRQISVEVYDRGNDGGSTPEDNVYTNFIKEGLLRDHNIEVTFVPVGRWVEVEELNNLLAAGKAPDICVTYNYPTVLTYANMGGVLDLSSYVDDYKDMLPNLWDLLGETNLYWDKDTEKGTIWAIEALLKHNLRVSTFVREDWLKKLNLSEPTNLQEFEDVLYAFKDNASVLLGADANRMIPFSISYDVGWRADHLLASFVPNNISDKDYYVNDFDDRHLLLPGYKEGVRKLNDWYNNGLIWKDFALYGAGDKTEDNLMKSGYVGAFMHNWDYPYRNGDEGIHANLKKLVGEDAAYIAVEPFANDEGVYKKFLSGPVDRKVFFPSTNDEPLASMLYLDWISNIENRKFIQIGEEGVTHEVTSNGAIKTLAATGAKIMNSPYNIDYTITLNGLDLGDEALNVKSLAMGYGGVDSRYIEKAYGITANDARIGQNVSVGAITSEEGMGPALSEKRDTLLNQAVVASKDKFDSVYDGAFKDYLNSGGQAIIDERAANWTKVLG